MPRHAVRLLATIGACSAFALALSSGAGAVEVEVNTPHINIPTPRINVPKPHVNVPTMNNVPTVNLRHHRLSKGANTLTNVNKLGGGQGSTTTTTTGNTPFVGPSNAAGSTDAKGVTTTVNTPFVAPTNGTGPAEGKVLTETVGGSGPPSGVQQQNAAAAAAAAISGAASGTGSPGGPNTSPANTWDASLATSHDGGINVGPVPLTKFNPGSLPTAQSTAAFYNSLAAGADNAAYQADVSSLQAPVTAAQDSAACATNPDGYQCLAAIDAAVNPLNDFEAYVDYLLFLLAYAENPQYGYSFTPMETADIETALQECLASPSTCAATITQLNAELAALGAPSGYQTVDGPAQVIQSPAQIVAFWYDRSTSPNGNTSLSTELSYQVAFAACNGIVCT